MPPLDQQETGKWKSLLLAATVHILLIAALFVGVQWKRQTPTAVEVEVWRAAPAPDPVPVPLSKPEPPEAKPEPAPKPEVKPEPMPPVKPDIAVKDDKKPKKEELKKPEPKKPEPKKPEPKKEEPKKEEPKKPEPERRPSFDEELNREKKQLQQQKDLQDQRARAEAEARQLRQAKDEQEAAAYKRGLDSYIARIAGKIRGNVVLPPGIPGNPEAILEIAQLPDGTVLGVKVRKSSGNSTLDAAIERAIMKSSPLPKPDQPELFRRELTIKYRPIE